MKCYNCGAPLILKGGLYYCTYCTTFQKQKVENQIADGKSTDFIVEGGVLVKYSGNQSHVEIPNGIVSIGPKVFQNNLAIEVVKFPDSVTSIQNNAFDGCINLKTLQNVDSIKSFGDEAFKSSGLYSVYIKANVEHIGKYCFAQIQNLQTVEYGPEKNLRLNQTFDKCINLSNVEMNKNYFFPSFHTFTELLNNPDNKRPTWGDAFRGTPYIKSIYAKYIKSYEAGVCPECGGKIKKGLFHKKCSVCKIDYVN